MTNGGQSSRQDYFTGDTLSKFSGAVVIASLLTTAILMIFSTDTLLTGLAVGLTISVAKWLQDFEKGRIKFDPTYKKSRRIAKGINIALMVLVNGVLIFFSASSTRGFFFDQLAEPGAIEEQSSFVQSLAPAIGTSAANTEIGRLRADTAAMSVDITELVSVAMGGGVPPLAGEGVPVRLVFTPLIFSPQANFSATVSGVGKNAFREKHSFFSTNS